ncbi:hypothetical protein [Clostridium sp.]|uniref:hypothetical protein n=1 Tax=Clostridium sp. TaxID=1506 RepID=UPI0025BB62E6|nr:hypothetical protein [Clostridium sp.]
MNINKKFRKIVISLTNNYKGISFKKCNDNYVGFFEYSNCVVNENLWFCKHLRNINKDKVKITKDNLSDIKNRNEKIIVIVLESPHIDEFNEKKFSVAPAPALGSTGCNLDKYFCKVINECFKEYEIENCRYHVILSNAIQYQCSLGTNTEVFRDRVWLKLWLNRSFKKYFINRLEEYSPDIIMNFCTKGSHKEDKLRPRRTKTVINSQYLKSIYDTKYIQNSKINIPKRIITTLQELTQEAISKYSINKSIICFVGNKHPSAWFNNEDIKITKI